jgi:hypothetical protein
MPGAQFNHNLIKIDKRQYRNPIYLAKEWQGALNSGQFASLADLARYYKISRARVTQIMNLLDLEPEVVDRIAALGNPLGAPVITERNLRSLLGLSIEEQKARITYMLSRR